MKSRRIGLIQNIRWEAVTLDIGMLLKQIFLSKNLSTWSYINKAVSFHERYDICIIFFHSTQTTKNQS